MVILLILELLFFSLFNIACSFIICINLNFFYFCTLNLFLAHDKKISPIADNDGKFGSSFGTPFGTTRTSLKEDYDHLGSLSTSLG